MQTNDPQIENCGVTVEQTDSSETHDINKTREDTVYNMNYTVMTAQFFSA